jgi:hypothetical protein
MLLAGRKRNRGWFSNRGKDIYKFSTESRPALGPTQRLVGALSPSVKQPRREPNQSPPSSADIKNAWCYTSLPPYIMLWCLIKHRECFIFTGSTCKERLYLLSVYSVIACFASWSQAESTERLQQLKVNPAQTLLAATEHLRVNFERRAVKAQPSLLLFKARLAGTRRRIACMKGIRRLWWLTSYETPFSRNKNSRD